MCCARLAAGRTQKIAIFIIIIIIIIIKCIYKAHFRGCHKCAQLCQAISSQLRHISTIGKNLLNNNVSATCPHNMVNFGLLTAEISWRVWGTPANFNGFGVLAALLHGILVVDVSQTLRLWTEGSTCIRQGGHHVGDWPTFLVSVFINSLVVQSYFTLVPVTV